MSENKLNEAQEKAVKYIDGPLIIVAGAGTGKTTVITKKIKYLIDQKLAKPDEILALTFNEKAAAEMQDRVDEMMEFGYLDMHISTFHAFCQRLLEQYGLDIGLPNRFRVLTQTDAWLLIRKHLDKFNLDYYRPIASPTKHIHEFVKHFSKCKDELISPEKYLEYSEGVRLDKDAAEIEEKSRLAEISNAYHVYNRLLLENNALDFGDLIYYTNVLLEKRPSILKRLREKFKYILVDEFQDVNWAQYQLVKKIADSGAQLTVVGDDDQSIYAFRGASVSNIMRFKDDFPKATEIVLTINYRSNQAILDKAYELILNNNPNRLEVKLKIDKKLTSKKTETKNKKQGNVIHTHHSSIDDEVKFVTEEVLRLKSEDKEAVWDDFAVLVRANSHADPFISAFEKQGVPYEFMAAAGLFRQPVVLDCLNFIKVIDSYHESAGIYRLLLMPIFEFKGDDMQRLTYYAGKKSISYYEALKRQAEIGFSKEGTVIAEKIISLIYEGIKNARSEKPSVVLYKFFEASGYLKFLATGEHKGDGVIIRQIHQLTQFFEYITNYESVTPGPTVSDFLDHFAQVIESGDLGIIKQPKDTPDSVNILTVHTAKGLEYKYVFIVNLVEERFPTRRRGGDIGIPDSLINEQLPEGDIHFEEERRLFYVAMTRAKERLYLTSADDYGGARDKKLSRFLSEIGFISAKSGASESSKLGKIAPVQTKKVPVGFAYELPKTFSFSQIQKYKKCPYQYKLAHILGLPTEGSPSFSFGSTMHNTLELFYTRLKELNGTTQNSLFSEPNVTVNSKLVKAPLLDELLKIYDDCWIPDWYKSQKQREEFYEKGIEILKDFYISHKNNWTLPVSMETGFTIKIGSYLLRGRIDRVDQLPDGKLEIIDYKTGQTKDKIVGDDKEQLLIYQIALKQLPEFRSIGEPGMLTYYYLNSNEKISFLGSEKDIAKLEDDIVSIIDSIKSLDFEPKPEKFACGHCEFRDICDYRA
ncbi:MAG: ATP-dependent DNA helicase [Candidatus Magasanikbacteria bacterium]|nr:ATP-dependent DNA helicase [Candidatus Magasanikbacteria bacterium]